MNLFNQGLEPVDPVKPIAPWVGGKRQLSKRLCKIIEAIPHQSYVEPFVGMGGVFFRRNSRPKAEVINDISGDVANLFRILQRHYQAFIDELKFSLAGRGEFNRLMSVDPETLTDLERAARFLYLQRMAFGGKVVGRTFGTSAYTSSRYNVSTLEPMLADIHERLTGVIIEHLDWSELIRIYDRSEVFFYLDPPYFDCEDYYGKDLFAPEDFQQMANQLASIEGMFILSLNDVSAVRDIFKRFHIQSVELAYTLAQKSQKTVREVIIMNDKARSGMNI